MRWRGEGGGEGRRKKKIGESRKTRDKERRGEWQRGKGKKRREKREGRE